jgi:NAD(P)-dependent dehydrogenase (short-subunit alcohol dehydrogenase family)
MPTALITGANRGLGLEFTRQYLGDGWQVITGCRKPDEAGALAVLSRTESALRVVRLDVADHDSVQGAARDIGNQPIDVLINNAGLFGPKVGANNDWRQSFGHIDYDIWRDVLGVNTMGPVKIAETFVDNVAASEQKKLITISSGLGSIGDTDSEGLFAYRTSKAAVNMAMVTLAQQLSPQSIIVALLCPGWCRTDMGGEEAPLEPAESVANMRRLIDGFTLEDTGTFTHHSGRRLPW